VVLQLRGAQGVVQLIERAAGDFQEARELLVTAAESFGGVSAHRVDRVFGLRVQLEIGCERLTAG
jgi:hypothetical protein